MLLLRFTTLSSESFYRRCIASFVGVRFLGFFFKHIFAMTLHGRRRIRETEAGVRLSALCSGN